MRRAFGVVAVLAMVVTCTVAADAATISYTDRATWTAAAGGVTGGENFNSFASDTSFLAGSVLLSSGMSISLLNSDGNANYNFIDVVPLASSESNVDGTADARIFTGGGPPGTLPILSFATPVYAFGADFVNLNDNLARTNVELRSGASLVTLLLPPIAATDEVRFWGFVSDSPITRIMFQRLQNDVFGMDNIQINTGVAAVPEPTTLLLFGSGLALAARRRRNRK